MVISLLVHRLFHKLKGILSLFAVHDTHQTVIVMVSDYALDYEHQFWSKMPLVIQRKEYFLWSSGAPCRPPFSLRNLLQQGPANTSVKACNGLDLGKMCCSIQNCHKGDRIDDVEPNGILTLSKQIDFHVFF